MSVSVKERRSFKSAPALNAEGTDEPMIKARVGLKVVAGSLAIESISVERWLRSVVERALRARGRFRSRILMCP